MKAVDKDHMRRRQEEHGKYTTAYQKPNYRMKMARRMDAVRDLAALPVRGSYLDVACGQGDMILEAINLGFTPARGTEIVPTLIDGDRVVYAEVHALPFADKEFDVVTMFDVIEHLVVGDDERACQELARVARSHILLTANNGPSLNHKGENLHINIRTYPAWDAWFRRWFMPAKVTWIQTPGRKYISECWRVDL